MQGRRSLDLGDVEVDELQRPFLDPSRAVERPVAVALGAGIEQAGLDVARGHVAARLRCSAARVAAVGGSEAFSNGLRRLDETAGRSAGPSAPRARNRRSGWQTSRSSASRRCRPPGRSRSCGTGTASCPVPGDSSWPCSDSSALAVVCLGGSVRPSCWARACGRGGTRVVLPTQLNSSLRLR